MAKRLKSTKSKNSESFTVIDDYTDPQTNKRSTFIVERLGSLKTLKEKYATDSREEVIKYLKQYVNELKKADNEENTAISIQLSPNKLIPLGEQRIYNLGYLYLRNILFSLGIKDLCNQIQERHRFKFDITSILADLVCTRIIYPGSKLSSYKDAHHFIETPKYQLEDVYRSLPILDKERYFIESSLYKNSTSLYTRNTNILYYDCTNFYFEIEEDDGFREYGKSKENRPNPIVQYGLFMDADGIPLADIVFKGSKNEQFSMRELEEQIIKDFGHSKFIVCADAGLNGWENKVYNDRKNEGAYIVTQPIRKLNKKLKDWCIEPTGWKVLGSSTTFDLNNLPEFIIINGKQVSSQEAIYYKDRWEIIEKKSDLTNKKYKLEEHLIVSFNFKFQKYQKHIRTKKLERAKKLLKNPGKINTNDQRNPRYYIKKIDTTENGEVATDTQYYIDESKVIEEAMYDGFYAVTTDLEDENISSVINANKQRWEIEESFEIMKSEFKTRPIYVSVEESIKGHLLTCFIALLVYRILEKKYLKSNYSCDYLIESLRNLNVTHLNGNNYVPSFTRTTFTDELSNIFGFQPAKEILTQKYLKKFLRIVNSKKSTKLNLK